MSTLVMSIADDQLIVATPLTTVAPVTEPAVTVLVVFWGAANPPGGAGVGTLVKASLPAASEVKLQE